MKQYEFKSQGHPYNVMPMSPSSNLIGASHHVGFNSFKGQPLPSTMQTSSQLNSFPTIKKQIENLLKQTEFLENKQGQDNFNSIKSQMATSNYSSVDRSTILDSNRPFQNANNNQKLNSSLNSYNSFTQVNRSLNNFFSNQISGSPALYKSNNSFTQLTAEKKQQANLNNVSSSFNQINHTKSPSSPVLQNPQKKTNLNVFQTNQSPQSFQKQNNQTNWTNNRPLQNRVQSFESLYPSSNKNNLQRSKSSKPMTSADEQEYKGQIKILRSINKSQYDQSRKLQKKISNLQIQNYKLQQSVKKFEQNQQYYKIQKKFVEQRFILLGEEHENKIKQVKAQYQKQIENLNNQIQKKQQKIINLIKQIKCYDSIKTSSQKNLTPDQVEALQNAEIQKLTIQLQKKQLDIKDLQNELKSRQENIQLLNQTFAELKNQIEDLKIFKQSVETQQYSNFDQILVIQMNTINDLKQSLSNMIEKNNQLKRNLIESQRKNQILENQIKINQLKHVSQFNSIKTKLQIQIGHHNNQIGTINKKMQRIDYKMKYVMTEAERKDDFIKKYLIKRSETKEIKQHIEQILGKYQQQFSSTIQTQLRAELEKAHKQIQLYQKYA